MSYFEDLARTYVVHDKEEIKGFFFEYRWLSNFYPCKVVVDGLTFPSSEHAFMYGKLESDPNLTEYNKIIKLSAADVKKWGKTVKLRDNWDELSIERMRVCLRAKFQNPTLRNKLLETGNAHLEEMNHWNDRKWGTDYRNGEGQNLLGKLLMEIRGGLK